METSPFGTWIGDTFTGVISYADDIFILSQSPLGLQCLITMVYDYGVKWKLKFNPAPGKSDIICFNAPLENPKFFLGPDEICLTNSLTHLGFLWSSKDKTLLYSHGQSKINNFVAQCNHLINRGLQKMHPKTIAHIVKVQIFLLLYGIEIGVFGLTQMSIWQRKIIIAIKSIFRCSKFCSNALLDCFNIMTLTEFINFRRSTLEFMIYNNPYTQSILKNRCENGKNNLCSDPKAMQGTKRKKKPYVSGTNGLVDSLVSLIDNWSNYSSQKQFRDLLHYKCSGRFNLSTAE